MSNEEESTALVQYGEWTPEQMEKESAEMISGGDFWKPPVGKSLVRFLPPKVGWPSPFVVRHQHFIEIPGVGKVVYTCPKMHVAQKCLSCGKADQLETTGNRKDSKIAETLRPKRSVMANVVVGKEPPPETPPVIWGFGKTVFDAIKLIRQDEEDGGNFLDPVKGFPLIVTRTGQMLDTKYTVGAARQRACQLANMEWIDIQTDLRKMVRIPTVDQQKRLLAGEDPRDVWAEDTGPGEGRPAAKAKTVDVTPKGRTAEDDLYDSDVDVD